jgi:hypothetical protein
MELTDPPECLEMSKLADDPMYHPLPDGFLQVTLGHHRITGFTRCGEIAVTGSKRWPENHPTSHATQVNVSDQ